jgi:hypothetical protein
MTIPNRRDNRKPCSITANAIICQIGAIAGFARGPNRERLSQTDLRDIAAALCNASIDLEILLERTATVSAPTYDEVDFG